MTKVSMRSLLVPKRGTDTRRRGGDLDACPGGGRPRPRRIRARTERPGGQPEVYGTFGDASVIGWAGNSEAVAACLGGSFWVDTSGPDGGPGSASTGAVRAPPTATGSTTTARPRGPTPTGTCRRGDDLPPGGATSRSPSSPTRSSSAAIGTCRLQPGVRDQPDRQHRSRVDPAASAGLDPAELGAGRGARARHRRSTTTSWPRTGSAALPWPSARRWPPRAASTSTSRTCARSGTTSWPASPRSPCPTPAWSTPTGAGFVYTQIARCGNQLNTGVNGYESEFSHDVVGILTNLFTQGYFTDAHALLEARTSVGDPGPVRGRAVDLPLGPGPSTC